MQIIKLGDGKRRVGSTVLEREEVSSLREAAVQCFESGVDPAETGVDIRDREPVFKDDNIILLPSSPSESCYCHVLTRKGLIEIPDQMYIRKMLQLF